MKADFVSTMTHHVDDFLDHRLLESTSGILSPFVPSYLSTNTSANGIDLI